MCTSSCARVNICAALPSAPLTKTSGAYSSTKTKPRNSTGSNLRCVLLPTMPLTAKRIPASSILLCRCRNASVHLGWSAAHPLARPSVRRISSASCSGSIVSCAERTKPNGSWPCSIRYSRIQAERRSINWTVSSRSGLGRRKPSLARVRK